MESAATITRQNCLSNKEKWNMSYSVKDAGNEKKLVDIKKEFDKIVVKAGGQTTLDDDEE